MMRRVRGFMALALVAGLAWGCEDTAGPGEEGVPESALTFLRFPPDLEPLVTRSDSFYAVKGENRRLVMRYVPEEVGKEGEEFLEFRVPGGALLRRPDGSLFAEGDSILIRVDVDEDGRFLFKFQPSGLEFDPDRAPRLRVTYRALNGDLNGDGEVDDDDEAFEDDLTLWRQEAPGDLWYPVGVIKLKDVDEIDGEIFGFTGFAIAG